MKKIKVSRIFKTYLDLKQLVDEEIKSISISENSPCKDTYQSDLKKLAKIEKILANCSFEVSVSEEEEKIINE